MTISYFPVPLKFQAQHECNLAVRKALNESKAKIDPLRDHRKSEIECIDWSCSGDKILVCARDGSLKMWRADRLIEERAWSGSWTWVEGSPVDSSVFIAVSWDGTVKLVDTRTPGGSTGVDTDLRQAKGDKFDKFLYVTWSIDGKHVAIVTRADLVHVMEVDALGSPSLEANTLHPGGEVYGVVFDNWNRLWVATGGTPGRILVYPHDLDGAPEEVVAHSHTSTCLTRTRDHQRILSGGGDALVALWDPERLTCLRTFPDSLAPVTCVSASSDGSLVAWGSGMIGGKDGESVITIAGIETGVHYASFSVSAPVTRLKWHPNKRILAYSMQQVSGVDSGVNIISFPSLE